MDRRLFFLMNMAQRKLYRHADTVCEETTGASMTQMAALMYVVSQPGCLQKDLAASLMLNKSAVTGLVERMAANGLLERTASATDARAVILNATEAGNAKVAQMKPLISQLNTIFTDEFSDAEIDTVLRFFHFILKTF